LLAPFSFAAGDLGGERVEARQPECPELVEPFVDLAQPAGLHGIDASRPIGTNRRKAAVAQYPKLLRHRGLGDAEFAVHDGNDVARAVLAGASSSRMRCRTGSPRTSKACIDGYAPPSGSPQQNAVVRAAAARAAASTVPTLIEASPLCSLRCGIWSLLVRRGHRSSLIYKYVPCPVRQC
jgi:hypothetical protein